jgi:transcription elongation GreA/GreB family factor
MDTVGNDKQTLLDALRSRVDADRATLARRQRDVQTGAVHEENRSEHAKDTRATEDSYLARGLAERVEDLQRLAERLSTLPMRTFGPGEAIGSTALVELRFEDDATSEWWLVVPGAGGFELETGGLRVRTVTPAAPLGRALIGLGAGDEGELRTPRGPRSFEVLAVR